MNFECLLYGFKGLLYGLPVSFIVTLMIYRSICEGLEMAFFIPWYSIAIAVGSVFLVVFTTMVYSMRKINKENKNFIELLHQNLEPVEFLPYIDEKKLPLDDNEYQQGQEISPEEGAPQGVTHKPSVFIIIGSPCFSGTWHIA